MPVCTTSVGEKASYVRKSKTLIHIQDSFYYVEYIYQNNFFLSHPDFFLKILLSLRNQKNCFQISLIPKSLGTYKLKKFFHSVSWCLISWKNCLSFSYSRRFNIIFFKNLDVIGNNGFDMPTQCKKTTILIMIALVGFEEKKIKAAGQCYSRAMHVKPKSQFVMRIPSSH